MKVITEYRLNEGRLLVGEDAFAVETEDVRLFTFPVRSGVELDGLEEADPELAPPRVTLRDGSLQVCWQVIGSRRADKQYRLEVWPEGFLFRILLKGSGRVGKIRYFSGDPAVPFPGAQYEVAGYALPQSMSLDGPRMTRAIGQEDYLAPGYMTPPPFVFPFWTEGVAPWIGIGLTAESGHHSFHRFQYKNQDNRCHFLVDLEERTFLAGEWASPGIWGGFGRDAADVVRAYSDFYREHGLAAPGHTHTPRWWKGPLYCGWGDQGEYAAVIGQDQKAQATQAFYQRMSDRLDELDLHPTAIIVDDKWQAHYGTLWPDSQKWPDMRAFVDAQHAKGRRVILWVKVWNGEGLDEDECIMLEHQPYTADPTSPKYRKRVFDTVHRLLSAEEGCMNCDGFKLDFVNNVLIRPEMRQHDRGVYGLELVKCMMKLFYDAAKAAKPDALINNSCAHPYFADVCDQVRLNDYSDKMRSQMAVMAYRTSIFRAAMPHATVDTDSSNRSSYREAITYCLRAQELGVPDLYMIGDCRHFAFTPEDWEKIRGVWQAYAARMDSESEENI